LAVLVNVVVAIRPVVPDLISEVAAEEASHFFGSRLPAVEESARGDVVEPTVHVELQVRTDGLVWVVLYIAEASEDTLGRSVSWRHLQF
jgi:hypothetical protein